MWFSLCSDDISSECMLVKLWGTFQTCILTSSPQRYVSVLHLLFLIKPAQVSKQKTLTYIVGGGVSFLWAASQASEVEHG